MGWLSRFKKKKIADHFCLVCTAAILDDNFSIVKYQYTDTDGTRKLSDAHLCESCTENIEKQARSREDVESF